MKSLMIWLAAFLLLGAATWYTRSQGADAATARLNAERTFAVTKVDQIGKIFMAHRNGSTVTLERQGQRWRYNGQFWARPNAMDNLLDAIRRIEMKYKPAQAAVPQMVRDLASNGIKVEIYDRNERLLRAYYVGGATPDERGTYLINEGFEQPYVAHLPGWEGNLRFRYSLQGEEWRDKTVFQVDPGAIAKVEIAYPKQKNLSFRLQRQAGAFVVEPFYDITPQRPGDPVAARVNAYLQGFTQLQAEGFENTNPSRDSIRQLTPFCIITVQDQQGDSHQARLFPIVQGPMEDPKTGQLLGRQTVERYFLDLDNRDFFLVQDRVFRRVLRPYDYFF